MSKITQVTPQKSNPERCNLYIDGEFVCAMSMLVVVQNQLLPGKEITQEKLLDMVFESEKENAFNYAVDYICKYVPSKKQMKHKLYEKKSAADKVGYDGGYGDAFYVHSEAENESDIQKYVYNARYRKYDKRSPGIAYASVYRCLEVIQQNDRQT